MMTRCGDLGLTGMVAVLLCLGILLPAAAQPAPPDWTPRMSSILRTVPDPPPYPTPVVEIVLRPELITAGQTARLQWRAFHAERVFMNGTLVAPYGDLPVSPDRNTEYRFAADGPGGRADEAITLIVQRPVRPPTATFILRPATIAAGQNADILWSTENASRVFIDSEPVGAYGVRTITPGRATAYELVAEGPGGVVTRRAFLEVHSTPTQPPPAVPEVALVIRFEYGQSRITPEAEAAVRILAARLERSSAPFLIIGHTDDHGADAYNLDLGLKRAASVRDRFIALGIAPERIELRSRGATEPLAPNRDDEGEDNPAGRRLNRRVEILVP